jgi:hypothetical protein
MARLFTYGFEEACTAGNGFGSGGIQPAVVTSPVRSGNFAGKFGFFGFAAGFNFSVPFGTGLLTGTYYFRFYLYLTQSLAQTTTVWRVASDQGLGVTLFIQTSNILQITDQTGTLTGTTVLSLNQWHRIEVRLDLTTTATGNVQVLIDGATEISASNRITTNNDFKNTIFGHSETILDGFYMDDIAINDNTGSAHNSWCGEGSVVLVYPSSDVSTQWTIGGSSPSATHFGGVADDKPGTGPSASSPDDGVTFNSTTADNLTDRLGISAASSIPSNALLKVMTATARVGITQTATPVNYQTAVWDDLGTLHSSPTVNPYPTWAGSPEFITPMVTALLSVDLTGKTSAQLLSFDLGYKSVTLSGQPCEISAIWASVEYLAPIVGTTTDGITTAAVSTSTWTGSVSSVGGVNVAATAVAAIVGGPTVARPLTGGVLWSGYPHRGGPDGGRYLHGGPGGNAHRWT